MKNWVIVLVLLLAPQNLLADECRPCVTSADGTTLIQLFEGFSPFRYKDSAGLDTIGFGHLIVAGERIDQPLLGDAATALLRKDLTRAEKGVNKALTIPLAQNKFDALSSFTFNVGVGKAASSTLFRFVNARRDAEVPPQFRRWVNVGGKPVRGLQVRREAEARLYETGH